MSQKNDELFCYGRFLPLLPTQRARNPAMKFADSRWAADARSQAAAFDPESMHPTRAANGAAERVAAYDEWLAAAVCMPTAAGPAAPSACVVGQGLNQPLHRPDHGHRTPAVWRDNNSPAVGAVPGLLDPHEPARGSTTRGPRNLPHTKLTHDRQLAAKPGASHWPVTGLGSESRAGPGAYPAPDEPSARPVQDRPLAAKPWFNQRRYHHGGTVAFAYPAVDLVLRFDGWCIEEPLHDHHRGRPLLRHVVLYFHPSDGKQ